MATSAVNATSGTSNTGTTSGALAGTKTLDRNAFLKLLITEMQNQDPMSPMENKDSIAQLAQFSSLEQMEKMNTSFESFGDTFAKSSTATQAYSLTGNWIDYKDPANPDSTLTGRVDSVSFENGKPKLKVGLTSLDLDSVTKVYPGYSSVGGGKASSQAISLMDKTISYYDPANPGAVKTGTVSGVSFNAGWPKLNVNGTSIDMADVLGVQESGSGSAAQSEASDLANAMVGKWVEYTDSNKATQSGYVKSVNTAGSLPRLAIGGSLVDLGNVTKVYRPT